MKPKIYRVLLIGLGLTGLVACTDEPKTPATEPDVSAPATSPAERFDINRIARGALLFQEHCAQCHGPEAQGHPDWQRAKQEGYVAAPPLDGTGPVTRLSQAQMVQIIRNGLKQNGKPVMPSWKGRVKDDEIADVITWFQALWPGEVYARWQQDKGNPAPKRASK